MKDRKQAKFFAMNWRDLSDKQKKKFDSKGDFASQKKAYEKEQEKSASFSQPSPSPAPKPTTGT